MTKNKETKLTNKEKEPNYEKLANRIYDFITNEAPNFSDAIASIELVKLWIYSDFTDFHLSEQNKDVDTIEVSGSYEKAKVPKNKKLKPIKDNPVGTELSEVE
jgi:hypothetical protein